MIYWKNLTASIEMRFLIQLYKNIFDYIQPYLSKKKMQIYISILDRELGIKMELLINIVIQYTYLRQIWGFLLGYHYIWKNFGKFQCEI